MELASSSDLSQKKVAMDDDDDEDGGGGGDVDGDVSMLISAPPSLLSLFPPHT